MRKWIFAVLLVFTVSSSQAIVMNNNPNELPPGCNQITETRNITVHAGTEYAEKFDSKVFTYDKRVYNLERCSKVTVTLANNDLIRHQWMVHGLPMETYPMGMFTIEVDGPGQDTGTFIVPNATETLLLHCGLPQHMQKGMKGMIKIGGGDGQISNIPGFTGVREPYSYEYEKEKIPVAPILISIGVGAGTGLLLVSVYLLWSDREIIQEE